MIGIRRTGTAGCNNKTRTGFQASYYHFLFRHFFSFLDILRLTIAFLSFEVVRGGVCQQLFYTCPHRQFYWYTLLVVWSQQDTLPTSVWKRCGGTLRSVEQNISPVKSGYLLDWTMSVSKRGHLDVIFLLPNHDRFQW